MTSYETHDTIQTRKNWQVRHRGQYTTFFLCFLSDRSPMVRANSSGGREEMYKQSCNTVTSEVLVKPEESPQLNEEGGGDTLSNKTGSLFYCIPNGAWSERWHVRGDLVYD